MVDSTRRQVAEDISNTIDSQDTLIVLGQDDNQPQANQPAAGQDKQNDEDDKPDESEKPDATEPKKVAGYAAADLLEAPVRPPQPKEVEGRDFTENKKILIVVAGAILLFVLAIILAVAGAVWLGLVLAVIAAALVALGVFLPLK